ncbi:MAG: 2-oxo acid dehydrogenase subunit E2 [Chthonomonadales bacterium]
MAHLFTMPTLGQTMEEGTILQWFKREGDPVQEGEALLEVMSDKASFEVPSPASGIVRKILAQADETVPVKQPIAIIGTAEEPIDGLLSGAPPTAPSLQAASATPPSAASTASPAPAAEAEKVLLSPRARRLADERGIPVTALVGLGTGPHGRVLERDVRAYLEQSAALVDRSAEAPRPRMTPLAAKIAGDLGVDVSALAAGIQGSRITADDVRRRAEEASQRAAPAVGGTEPAVAEVVPFRGLRKMSADTVTRSRQTAPHVTLVLEVDMSKSAALLSELRPEIQRTHGVKLTYTDILVKAVARALKEHPQCNAALVGDEIRLYADRNIGCAVDTERGLVVPVVRRADTKSLGEVSVELKGLIERCRAGKQTQEDLSGGTFTITNLGPFGIDVFDPILVPPQSCILGVCRIAEKPVVVEGQVAVRPMMNLCLSVDHRVVDGAPAARFLQHLKELLETPLRIFI